MKNLNHMSLMMAATLGFTEMDRPVPKKKKRSLYRWLGIESSNRRKPHQSAREKMRRVRQGKAGTCYVHGAQYRD